jgi:ATP-dependent helicase/nuclease subunit A
VLGAAKLIDKIMTDSGLSAKYSADGGEKLANIRRLAQEAYSATGELSLNAFLNKLKMGGYKINAPVPNTSDSIKVMTMHASKGLEFPVVIIADVMKKWKGMPEYDISFDDDYCFAFKSYDVEKKVRAKTLLTSICALRAKREDIKNELNLFYVACTRAMCSLHIMASELIPFVQANMLSAECHGALFDFSPYDVEYMDLGKAEGGESGEQVLITKPSEEEYQRLKATFMPTYPQAASVNLPVKSSASVLLKLGEEDNSYAENVLFEEESDLPENDKKWQGKTSAEQGTAYHRYLQLCDFAIKDKKGLQKQLESFVADGLMPKEQAELISPEHLEEILAMPAFDNLKSGRLFREQEFLCRLPAKDFLPTDADDGVLIQGAIDLLAVCDDGVHIIDYKYSKKDDKAIVAKYAAQLSLYKKAVAKILKVEENTISATIINIFLKRQINLKI